MPKTEREEKLFNEAKNAEEKCNQYEKQISLLKNYLTEANYKIKKLEEENVDMRELKNLIIKIFK